MHINIELDFGQCTIKFPTATLQLQRKKYIQQRGASMGKSAWVEISADVPRGCNR